jgi:hypothetical protein
MAGDEWFPPQPYLEHRDQPVARPARPVCQGDVFIGLPVVRGIRWKRGQWKASLAVKDEALSMLIAHPCSARSNETHNLKDDISLAPIVPRAKNWGPPWRGHYEIFPLPDLYQGADYMADLSKAFPVVPEYLTDRRIACLSEDGLAALLDRLARNATRLEPLHVPGHFHSEAERLRMEFDLWETWFRGRGKEGGFQEWLEEEWMPGATRRQAMRGHFEEIHAALAAELGIELEPA